MEIPQWTRAVAVAALPFIANPGISRANDLEVAAPTRHAIVGEQFAAGEPGTRQKEVRDIFSGVALQILGGIYDSVERECPGTTVESLVPKGASVQGIRPHVETVSHYAKPDDAAPSGHTVVASLGSNQTGYVIVDPHGPEGIACVGRYMDEQNVAAASVAVTSGVVCNVHADFKQSAPDDGIALFVACGMTSIPNSTELPEHYKHQAGTTPSFVRKL